MKLYFVRSSGFQENYCLFKRSIVLNDRLRGNLDVSTAPDVNQDE